MKCFHHCFQYFLNFAKHSNFSLYDTVKVHYGLNSFEKLDHAVVTTGTFDGVHIGHLKILNRLISVAREYKSQSVLFTFDPHPRSVLQPDADIKMLCTLEEKIELLKKTGLDHLIVYPFSLEFARTTSLVYVRDILVNQIGTKKLVIGYDHHFGRNREGSFEHLVEYGPTYGFDVEEISALDVDQINVSSTKIRKALAQGDLHTARTYLSYDYQLNGKVIKGRQLGREIGFPTANIDISNHIKLIPKNGVYAVKVEVDNITYNGMLNIGNKPTTGVNERNMEVNIFDLEADLYEKNVKVIFKEYLREEHKYESIEALQQQLAQDKEQAIFHLK